MGRYPVQNYAYAMLMHIVYKVHKVLRRTVPCGRTEVARYLIAPGRVEGIFADTHNLDMRIAHILHVFAQLVGKAAIV